MANANAKKTYIWLKMTKEWGGFHVGDIVRFGTPKGLGRVDAGEGVKVDPPAEELKKRGRPKIETATIKPKKETAEVTPKEIKTKKKVDTKKGG